MYFTGHSIDRLITTIVFLTLTLNLYVVLDMAVVAILVQYQQQCAVRSQHFWDLYIFLFGLDIY